MNKKIIYIIVTILVFIGLFILGNYLLSFRDIEFTLSSDVSGITINNTDMQNIKEVSSSGTVRLQTGNYIIIPIGIAISNDQIFINVTKDDKTIIDPDYNEAYLSSLLPDTEQNILNTLSIKY